MLLARWSVLAALVLAVGAVAIWSGTGSQQTAENSTNGGMSGLLASALQETTVEAAPDEQAEIQAVNGNNLTSPDAKAVEQPQNAEASPPTETTAASATDSSDSIDFGNTVSSAESENEDVYDYAPEPWVGDEALSAEAALLQMLPPIDGTVSRSFGYSFDKTFADYRFHDGLDYAAQVGTSVFAPIDGVISEINDDDFFGASIALTHGNKLVTRYFGITPESSLKLEQSVIAGEKIGTVAHSPVFEDGEQPHLHWEVLLDNKYVNPAEYQVGD
jgi:murein DD-endopeptidase MepM/ murein hydrolase activator NlpD